MMRLVSVGVSPKTQFLNQERFFSWALDSLDWWVVGGATSFAHNENAADASRERGWDVVPGALSVKSLEQMLEEIDDRVEEAFLLLLRSARWRRRWGGRRHERLVARGREVRRRVP